MTANQPEANQSNCNQPVRPKLSPQEQEMFLKQLNEIEGEEAEIATPPAVATPPATQK